MVPPDPAGQRGGGEPQVRKPAHLTCCPLFLPHNSLRPRKGGGREGQRGGAGPVRLESSSLGRSQGSLPRWKAEAPLPRPPPHPFPGRLNPVLGPPQARVSWKPVTWRWLSVLGRGREHLRTPGVQGASQDVPPLTLLIVPPGRREPGPLPAFRKPRPAPRRRVGPSLESDINH